MKKTLLLLSHQDDEVLSCGGLLLNRQDDNEVLVVTMFNRKYNYGKGLQGEEEETQAFLAAKKLLGYDHHLTLSLAEGEPHLHHYYDLLELIEAQLRVFDPDEVVIHSEHDTNQDHRFMAELCRIALRPANLGSVSTILACRGLEGTYPRANHFEYMLKEDLDTKLAAMQCYKRESREGNHPRSPQNIEAYHRLVGASCGYEFAEPYDLIMQR